MTTISEDVKLDFCDVLLMPKRSTIGSRSELGDLSRTFKFKHSKVEYTGTPIVAANMDTIGTFEMAKAFKKYNMSVALHKFYTAKSLIEYFSSPDRNDNTFYSMGITQSDYDKFREVEDAVRHSGNGRIQYVCVDVANGYSRKFVSFVEALRKTYGESIVIMAGNVVTGDMVYDLLERGADIVKVGIGPGSVCTTRRITGVGYPQLSAILECQDAAHGADGLICGDGGIVIPGDFSKAFAAGSDFVMAGGIFAGHQECAGEIIGLNRILKPLTWPDDLEPRAAMMFVVDTSNQKEYVVEISKFKQFIHEFNHKYNLDRNSVPIPKEFEWAIHTEILPNARMRFYGMSSQEAMEKHYGGKADYRAAEGKVVEVPYKGSVSKTVEEILGGIRSAGSMIGARRLKDMSKCATFVRVGRQLNESLSGYNV